jgi:hypothetical protein
MARHPVRQDTRPVVHYYPTPDPAPVTPGDMAEYRRHVAELAARRRTDRILTARWRQRQIEIAERDRRNRRRVLAVIVPLTAGALAALGTAGWLLWQALAGINLLAVLVVVALGAAVVGKVGHRCITVVQHWH